MSALKHWTEFALFNGTALAALVAALVYARVRQRPVDWRMVGLFSVFGIPIGVAWNYVAAAKGWWSFDPAWNLGIYVGAISLEDLLHQLMASACYVVPYQLWILPMRGPAWLERRSATVTWGLYALVAAGSLLAGAGWLDDCAKMSAAVYFVPLLFTVPYVVRHVSGTQLLVFTLFTSLFQLATDYVGCARTGIWTYADPGTAWLLHTGPGRGIPVANVLVGASNSLFVMVFYGLMRRWEADPNKPLRVLAPRPDAPPAIAAAEGGSGAVAVPGGTA